MSIRTKLLGLTTAVALVAGASLAAAAPAAAAEPKVKGTTTIALNAQVAGALASLGVSINATEGGKVKKGKIVFPVTGEGDGFISHKGQLQFIKDGAVAAAGNDPMIEWPTSEPLTAAKVAVSVLGNPLVLFDVTDLKIKTKVKKNTKKKQRVTTKTITGAMSLTTDVNTVALLNQLLGTELLQAGMPMGSTTTKVITIAKCANKKCTR